MNGPQGRLGSFIFRVGVALHLVFTVFEKVRVTSDCSFSDAVGVFLFPGDMDLPAFCPGKPSVINCKWVYC